MEGSMTQEPERSEARFCGNCGAGRVVPTAEFCARCGQPFGELAARPGAVSPSFLTKAGFWRRSWAFGVDFLLVAFVVALAEGTFGWSEGEIADVVYGLATTAYFIALWSSAGGGQTVGMRALGIRVVRVDGSELSVPGALLRYMGLSLALAVLFLGVIAVAFDHNKQGWHDKMVGTYVVRT